MLVKLKRERFRDFYIHSSRARADWNQKLMKFLQKPYWNPVLLLCDYTKFWETPADQQQEIACLKMADGSPNLSTRYRSACTKRHGLSTLQ